MRAGAYIIFLGIVLVLAVLTQGLTGSNHVPRDAAYSGPDWESPNCMRDTWEVRPYAFAVCYERKGDSLR
jgi:hypothetical protein